MKAPFRFTIPDEIWRRMNRARYKEVSRYLRVLCRIVHKDMEDKGAYEKISNAMTELVIYGKVTIGTETIKL